MARDGGDVLMFMFGLVMTGNGALRRLGFNSLWPFLACAPCVGLFFSIMSNMVLDQFAHGTNEWRQLPF